MTRKMEKIIGVVMPKVWEIVAETRSSKNMPSSRPLQKDNKRFVHQNYTEKRAHTNRLDGCYICAGPHEYVTFPKMKNLCAIQSERKEKDAQY